MFAVLVATTILVLGGASESGTKEHLRRTSIATMQNGIASRLHWRVADCERSSSVQLMCKHVYYLASWAAI